MILLERIVRECEEPPSFDKQDQPNLKLRGLENVTILAQAGRGGEED
jgi:hypothetical protein